MTTQSNTPKTDNVPADTVADADEIRRLRSEVSTLNARLDTRLRRATMVARLRRISAAVLIAITAWALVVSVIGVWAATTVLNTGRWVQTVGPLPQNPAVSTAVADYTTTQVFEAVNVEQRLRDVLPSQAAFVAGPVAGQVRNTVQQTVTNVLRSDRFHTIWLELNRRAHQRALAIINGTSDVVVAQNDRVEIDLLPLVNQVLRQLSAQLPTMFGKQINLPDLSSGEIPDNLRVRVQDALGVTLPANFAQFTIYDSGQLKAAQDAAKTAKRGLVLFVIVTIVLLAAALLISTRRRRTLLQLGLWLVAAAVTMTAALRAVRSHLLDQIPAGVYRDGAAAATTTIFSVLRTRGTQLIWIGAILAILMYLVGPGRAPRWLRHQTARAASATARAARPALAQAPTWTAQHVDLLRVGALVVAAILALLLTSWTSLLVIAIVLAAFELAVTLVARYTPKKLPAKDPPPSARVTSSMGQR